MELAAAVFITAMFATPGIRLLRLRLRNGSGPEGWLAAFFLGLAIGIPLRLYLTGNTTISADWARIGNRIAVLGLFTAAPSLTVFTWLVFRRNSGIAKLWTGLTICVLSVCCLVLFALDEVANQTHPVSMLANLWAISGFTWTFFECAQYYIRMRRRAEVGLGDPIVQNRFLLWSIWTGSFVFLPVVVFAIKITLLANTAPGEQVVASAGLMTFVRVIVLVCSSSMLVSIWLSFFAPQAYLARIRGEANKASS